MEKRIIVLFRKDFRLFDHPALYYAAERGAVLPVYIYDEARDGEWALGGAAKWWLHHALTDIQTRLQERHVPLIIQKGDTLAKLQSIVQAANATSVYWNRRYEPDAIAADAKLMDALREQGIECEAFTSHVLLEPSIVKKENGDPYKVFTPFYKAMQKHVIPAPLKKIKSIRAIDVPVMSVPVEELGLLPSINWTREMEKLWTPTEDGAYEQLKQFVSKKVRYYNDGRDFPADETNSSLAPYFAFGQLSVRLVHHYVKKKVHEKQDSEFEKGAESFLRQLVWRDFAYHLLLHFPHTVKEPLNRSFSAFPWSDNKTAFTAWTKGRTGYPFVDAGMRELWTTGFMHNRVRMVVASFLVKHLLIPWQRGADWFWDTLLDADLANNSMGWQWVAGSGADAAPYFRIFNPVTQGEKFDKNGEYIRKWVPELSSLPDKYVHKPWEAPEHVLMQAGVVLGETYPLPLVDHKEAREQALRAYDTIKQSSIPNTK